MKKWVLGLITQLAILPAAYGLVSGNPADPMLGTESLWFGGTPWWIPKLGFQRDYITDRKLESDTLLIDRIDEFEIVSDQAILALDFCQRIEVYGTVGAARLFSRSRPDNVVPGNFQTHRDSQFNDGTIWSAGGKAILVNWRNTVVSVDGKYSEFCAQAAWDDLHTGALATQEKVYYKEWQASLGVAYNFCYAVPYICLNYSGLKDSKIDDIQATASDSGTTTLDSYRLHTRRFVGLSLGASFTPTRNFYVTVEARVLNERSLTVQGQIKL